jgi:hypothetical protein
VGEIWDMLQNVAKRHLAEKEIYGRKSDTCVDFEDRVCSDSSPIAVVNLAVMLPLCVCVCARARVCARVRARVCVCVCVHVCNSLQFIIFGLLYISPLYGPL